MLLYADYVPPALNSSLFNTWPILTLSYFLLLAYSSAWSAPRFSAVMFFYFKRNICFQGFNMQARMRPSPSHHLCTGIFSTDPSEICTLQTSLEKSQQFKTPETSIRMKMAKDPVTQNYCCHHSLHFHQKHLSENLCPYRFDTLQKLLKPFSDAQHF